MERKYRTTDIFNMMLTWLLLCCVTTVIRGQTPPFLKPLVPNDICVTDLDCGAVDITPDPLVGLTNPQKYRILSKFDQIIYIGGLQEFIKIDARCSGGTITDETLMRSSKIPSCLSPAGPSGSVSCEQLGGSGTKICDNYIRIVEKVNDKLLVCGTNDAFPRCYSFDDYVDSGNCIFANNGNNVDGTSTCAAEQSYEAYRSPNHLAPSTNWDQNSTLALIGNELFLGALSIRPNSDVLIQKFDFNAANLGSFSAIPYEDDLATYTDEQRSVNQANFVGRPYQYTEGSSTFVLYFFREAAVEHINQGNIIYSRVARVCQNDAGISDKWGSYIKARLGCFHPGDPPMYVDEIQDIVVTDIGGETYFYGVFNGPPNGPHQSAVCVFKLTDIHNVFQTSKFRGTQSSQEIWQPINPDPIPRTGFSCSVPNTDTTFQKNNPLLDDPVPNFNYHTARQSADGHQPLFASSRVRYSQIVIDNRGSSNLYDAVIFIGTDAGEIWKVTDPGPGVTSLDFKAVTLWQSSNGSPITGLELLENSGSTKSTFYLYATTHDHIVKVNLQFGKAQTQNQFDCIYNSYLSSSEFTQPQGVISSPGITVTYCPGHNIQLTCQGKLDSTLGLTADTRWMFTPDGGVEVDITASGRGHFVTFNKIRSGVLDPLSYLYVTTHAKTSGSYTCVVFWSGLTGGQETVTSTLTVNDCTTSGFIERGRARYANGRMDALDNKDSYNTMNQGNKIDFATCEDCPWN